MRLALPNAAFIGFTGTPLFKQDELTKRIFGDYVSRYDFKRSEEDGATVKLVYENRGEKLGVARLDLNDRIAEKIEEAELDPDQAGAAREAARQGLRGHHRRRAAGQDRGRFRRALRDAVGVGQVDAGLHRQDHLRPDAPAHHAALAGEGCEVGARRRRSRRSSGTPTTTTRAALRRRRSWRRRPTGSTRRSSRSSSARRRTRSPTSRSGASTSSRIAP